MVLEHDVDITDQLGTRPERGLDPRRLRGALGDLARRMVDEPRSILARLVDLSRELTGAESAGISLYEEVDGAPGVFRWSDLAGRLIPFVGSTMRRDFSPSGTTLDRNRPILLTRPERVYPFLEPGGPISEVLLVPLHVDSGAPFGTLWVVHHDAGKSFDGGDARALSELANFAGVAHRIAEDAIRNEVVDEAVDAAAGQADARYRSLFVSIDAGFCVIEMKFDENDVPVDYRFIEANRAFERMTELGDVVGLWMRDLKPAHEQHWFDVYGRVALTGDPVRFENEAAELDRWFDVHAYRIGRPGDLHVAILFNDITARRRAETRLQTLNLRLEEQVEARTVERDRLWRLSRDPFLIADVDGRWLRVSPAWTDVLGWSETDLLGRTSEWMEHPDDVGRTRHEIGLLNAGATTRRFENRFRGKDGRYRWFSWTAVQEDDLIFCVARDVTDEKVQVEALRLAEEGMRQSQKVEAVGQLTGGVAHDFNNLLTVIRGSVDLLRRPGVSDERRTRYIDAISKTVDRATKLTSQLLAFARRQTLQPEIFDVSVSVREIADMVRTLTGSQVTVVTEIPDEPCFIDADRSQFDTAIVNMAVNARDAMNAAGLLGIAVGQASAMPGVRSHPPRSGRFVTLAVTDTGSGIDPTQMDRIFEPFFTTKAVGEGTGLGLSQVFGFAKQSGGDILVQSTPGHGSTFTLYLPLAAPTSPGAEVDRSSTTQTIGAGSCILVVEDNGEVGLFATQALTELGYRTTLAVDAASALAELADHADRYDVVFSDVVMPGMSGIELARQIRRSHPTLPIILTSGYSAILAETGTHGFELLHKPYSIDELSRVLQKSSKAPVSS